MIYLITGPLGAGKSTYSNQLAEQTNSVIFSIDQWMGQLYLSDMAMPPDLNWISSRVNRCEVLIWSTAVSCSQAGHNVILDIGLMKNQQRKKYLQKAAELGLAVELHYLTASTSVRLERVLNRNTEKGATFSFEVTPEMFHYMDAEFEVPVISEKIKWVSSENEVF